MAQLSVVFKISLVLIGIGIIFIFIAQFTTVSVLDPELFTKKGEPRLRRYNQFLTLAAGFLALGTAGMVIWKLVLNGSLPD